MITLRVSFTISCLFLLALETTSYANTGIEALERKSRALATKTEMEAQRATVRWNHARELLGKSYQKSVVKMGEDVAFLDDVVYQWTKRALKKAWKKDAKKVSKTIIQQSEKYGFDPVFLMAVIENESSFNPVVIGTSGEIGLMQITPQTAEWIAEKYELPWKGVKSLKDPVTNIIIGSAYLAYLRERFDFHSQLYLAAYNMGSTNVLRALEKQVWPKEYPSRVMQRYVRFYTELKEEIQNAIN